MTGSAWLDQAGLSAWWPAFAAVACALVLVWLLLVALLWWTNRRSPLGVNVADGLRLLPDVIRLLRRVAADAAMPRGVRIRLVLLLGYLLMPLDIIPDFIPVLGYADDVIIIAWALRSVARRVGADALARHWPGSAEGLALILRLAGVPAG